MKRALCLALALALLAHPSPSCTEHAPGHSSVLQGGIGGTVKYQDGTPAPGFRVI